MSCCRPARSLVRSPRAAIHRHWQSWTSCGVTAMDAATRISVVMWQSQDSGKAIYIHAVTAGWYGAVSTNRVLAPPFEADVAPPRQVPACSGPPRRSQNLSQLSLADRTSSVPKTVPGGAGTSWNSSPVGPKEIAILGPDPSSSRASSPEPDSTSHPSVNPAIKDR